MGRRRPPQRRPGPTPSSRARKTSENGRGSGKGGIGAVGELEWAGLARGVLLVALAAGVATFLFYPDITRLVDHWRNGSRDTDPHVVHERDVQSEPQQLVGAARGRDSPTQRPAAQRQTAGSDQGQGHGGSAADLGKPAGGKTENDERSSRPAVVPGESSLSGDLMEDEEEEEDAAEMELMEEEDAAMFVDIGDDEEEEAEEGEELTEARQGRRQQGEDGVQPAVLRDGQTITFTPVNPGDQHAIRLGGRPKDAAVPTPHDAKTASPDAAKTGTSKNRSAKQQSPKSRQEKASDPASPNASKRAVSEDRRGKQTSSKTASQEQPPDTNKSRNRSKEHPNGKEAKTGKGKPQKKETQKKNTSSDSSSSASDVDSDLPEEVRSFKPTYLRTVTAKKIFAGGRRIPPIELLPQKPTNSSVRVFLFNEFLSEAECDGLKRVHDAHVQDTASLPPLLCFDSLITLRKHLKDVKKKLEVTPNDFIKGTRCVNATFSRTLSEWLASNWSYSTAFYPGESRFSHTFAARVHEAMGLDPKNGGKFQITSYPTDIAYKAHTDCVLQGTDQRDRVATVIVYLDDVPDGGETKFPELGIWVKPRKGRALVWNNMSPEAVCEPHSLHVASKVKSGSKYILIRWYYYKSFYSLGRRPSEPPVPARPPGTPRVSCDDYDNGSCRWYDEWNNDHLLEYELNKYTLI